MITELLPDVINDKRESFGKFRHLSIFTRINYIGNCFLWYSAPDSNHKRMKPARGHKESCHTNNLLFRVVYAGNLSRLTIGHGLYIYIALIAFIDCIAPWTPCKAYSANCQALYNYQKASFFGDGGLWAEDETGGRCLYVRYCT